MFKFFYNYLIDCMGDLSCHLQNLAYCDVESKLIVVIGRKPI